VTASAAAVAEHADQVVRRHQTRDTDHGRRQEAGLAWPSTSGTAIAIATTTSSGVRPQ
jgi:hypothetical protein